MLLLPAIDHRTFCNNTSIGLLGLLDDKFVVCSKRLKLLWLSSRKIPNIKKIKIPTIKVKNLEK